MEKMKKVHSDSSVLRNAHQHKEHDTTHTQHTESPLSLYSTSHDSFLPTDGPYHTIMDGDGKNFVEMNLKKQHLGIGAIHRLVKYAKTVEKDPITVYISADLSGILIFLLFI